MKKQMHRLFYISLLFSSFSIAQGWAPAGSRSRALSDASVTLGDVWAYHHNPGATAAIKQFSIGVSYENRFLLKELQTQSLAMVIPMKKGVLSAGAQSFGYTQFRTLKAGVGYGLQLSDIFSVGVQMNVHQVRIGQGYGNTFKATGEAGILAQIKPMWNVGFSVYNFSRTQLSAYQEDRMTTIMRLGSSYRFSDKLLLCVEGEKHIEYPIRGKVGMEYSPTKQLSFRTGFSTQPIELNAGFGYKFKESFQLDLGSAYTQQIGWSPNLSFAYQIK